MPPGSLSTLAVMNPGPRIDRNARIRYLSTDRLAVRRTSGLGMRCSPRKKNQGLSLRLQGERKPKQVFEKKTGTLSADSVPQKSSRLVYTCREPGGHNGNVNLQSQRSFDS